jgi:hypothetical protein
MSQTNPTGFPTFISGAAIPPFRRVVLGADRVVTLAPITAKGIGVSISEATASGQRVTVQLFTQGTCEIGTDSQGTPLGGSPAYAGANGLVSQEPGSPAAPLIGTFAESGAPLDSLEIIPA